MRGHTRGEPLPPAPKVSARSTHPAGCDASETAWLVWLSSTEPGRAPPPPFESKFARGRGKVAASPFQGEPLGRTDGPSGACTPTASLSIERKLAVSSV